MNTKEIMDLDDEFIIHTYGRQPIALDHGNGVKVTDVEGKEYIDCFAGIAVNCLGHNHPQITEAITRQAQKLIHISNLYYSEEQVKLAKLLLDNTTHDKLFYCNSGAEANEGAIKLARKHTQKSEIITAINSFHGRTSAALAATGQVHYHEGFGPLTPGFKYVEYGDIKALESLISDDTAAVLLEPIQGEGGVVVASESYLKEVETLCHEKGILLIFDEVQTGMGRTGTILASEQYSVKPDITTLAKGIAAGYPFGAILANKNIADSFVPGDHGSTFAGNPLGSATAYATLNTILGENILDNVKKQGEYLTQKLETLKTQYPDKIKEVRGKGLLIGMELSKEGAELVNQGRDEGLLLNCTAGNVIRFAPPLIITTQEIDTIVEKITKLIKEY